MKKISHLSKMNMFRKDSGHFNMGRVDGFLILLGLIIFLFILTAANLPQQDQTDPEKDFVYNVVEVMPEWIPGEHKGKKVKVQYVLRVPLRAN